MCTCGGVAQTTFLGPLDHTNGDNLLEREIASLRTCKMAAQEQYLEASRRLHALELMSTHTASSTSTPSARSSCDSRAEGACELPPVIEHYFQKARQLYVKRERLTEMDLDHLDFGACASEVNLRAMGAHEDLQPSHENRRQKLVRAISLIQNQLELQLRKCLAQGLDPDNFRYCQ